MSASLVFHLIREHLIGLVLDLGQDKCVRNHTLFVLLTKKLVSVLTIVKIFPLTYSALAINNLNNWLDSFVCRCVKPGFDHPVAYHAYLLLLKTLRTLFNKITDYH